MNKAINQERMTAIRSKQKESERLRQNIFIIIISFLSGILLLLIYTPHGTFRLLDDSIGYINLGKLKKKAVKKAFTTFRHMKGIILDLRNYPYEPVIDRVSGMILQQAMT